MTVEESTIIALQVLLAAVWTSVAVFMIKTYIQMKKRGILRARPESPFKINSIRKSFLAFMLAFMPALFVWLPILSIIELADNLYVPLVLTWLVLLLAGSLHYYLSLIPRKSVWTASLTSKR